MGVGVLQKISALCKGAGNFFFLLYFSFTFIFFSALLYMYIFLVPSACSLRFGSKI